MHRTLTWPRHRYRPALKKRNLRTFACTVSSTPAPERDRECITPDAPMRTLERQRAMHHPPAARLDLRIVDRAERAVVGAALASESVCKATNA
jgi:hypothetical protein